MRAVLFVVAFLETVLKNFTDLSKDEYDVMIGAIFQTHALQVLGNLRIRSLIRTFTHTRAQTHAHMCTHTHTHTQVCVITRTQA